MKKESPLNTELIRLLIQKPIENADYFQFNLFSDQNSDFHYSFMSHWCGFDEENPNIELREPSLINVQRTLQVFNDIDEPALIVNSEKDLYLFLNFFGGHSIITKELCEVFLIEDLKPHKNLKTFDQGFLSVSDIPKSKLNRAANPKLRMKIFKRDNRRCKVCGASPQNNEHVELHLHHITPFAKGGLTDENNLITLCHTCHKGLEPHYDLSLYSLIDITMLSGLKTTESYQNRINRNIKLGLERHNASAKK